MDQFEWLWRLTYFRGGPSKIELKQVQGGVENWTNAIHLLLIL